MQGAPEISTIHISGFPEDVRDRELRNLCRLLPGYEDCSLRKGPQAAMIWGFVKFMSRADAVHAISILNGLVFDDDLLPEYQTTLSVQLAKRDMEVRRRAPSGGFGGGQFNAGGGQSFNAMPRQQFSFVDDIVGGLYPQFPVPAPFPQFSGGLGGNGAGNWGGGFGGFGGNNFDQDAQNTPDDLRNLFQQCRGYKCFHITAQRPGARFTMAFVKFDTVEAAQEALEKTKDACESQFAKRSYDER